MSNTINNLSSTLSLISKTDANAAVKQVPAQPQPSGGTSATGKPVLVKTDQATLSLASELITKALSGTDARTEKVSSLQKSISAGTYHVDSARVADKLLQSLLGIGE